MLCLSCVGGGQSPSVVLWPSCCLFTLVRVTSLASSMYSRTVSTQYPRTGHVTRKPAKPAAETTEQITPAFTTRRSVALVWTDASGVIDAEQHRHQTQHWRNPDTIVHRTHTNPNFISQWQQSTRTKVFHISQFLSIGNVYPDEAHSP